MRLQVAAERGEPTEQAKFDGISQWRDLVLSVSNGRLPKLVNQLESTELPTGRLAEIVMRLDELPQSERIEDRRGGLSGSAGRRGGLGIGATAVLDLIGWALGIAPRLLIGGAEMISRSGQTQQQTDFSPSFGPVKRLKMRVCSAS